MERKGDEPWANLYEERPYLTLNQWSVADNGGTHQCNLRLLLLEEVDENVGMWS